MSESAPAPVVADEPVGPLFLTAEILAQAESWCGECRQRWNESDVVEISRAVLCSPVDGSQRLVAPVLRNGVSDGLEVQGKTVPKIRRPDDSFEAGYTVAINRRQIALEEELLHVLLHEITHAVDPYFDRDHEALNPGGKPGGRRLNWNQNATQPSELRAFVSMWAPDIRRWARDPQGDIDSLIRSCCAKSEGFRELWDRGEIGGKPARELLRKHFLATADYWKKSENPGDQARPA
jgi:hypothetical protein